MASKQLFDPDPVVRKYAAQLYEQVEPLPLISPHGHVSPALFANEDYRFGSPAELLVIPDHYVTRMLYSAGLKLEDLGVPAQDGAAVERDQRRIWQRFAEHFSLFRGTPSGLWIQNELRTVFRVEEKLTGESAQRIYDQIEAQIQLPEFSPRNLYAQFNLEVLCTTDAATDPLAEHQKISASGWQGRIVPTFRPDAVLDLDRADWHSEIRKLSEISGIAVKDFASYIAALEDRRAFFKSLGATATDHGVLSADTTPLSQAEAGRIFDRALTNKLLKGDAERFAAHMLYEMARMSSEDGLVMQLHVGSYRNHNWDLFDRFGPDIGADIPIRAEFTRALQPLLNAFGNHPNLTVVVFTLDESAYARELAPLAGHYPSVKVGPPWWFHDSPKGIARYLDQVIETAGVYNTAGFNDDTRAFLSIPARHEVWRRASCNWVAGLLARKIIDEADASAMATALAYGQAKQTYKL